MLAGQGGELFSVNGSANRGVTLLRVKPRESAGQMFP